MSFTNLESNFAISIRMPHHGLGYISRDIIAFKETITLKKTPHDKRIERVCAYVLQNLDEDLTVDGISAVAAFSKYHFHRVFTAYTGQSVTKFIQLMRFKRASFQLAFEPALKIIDIALAAGFDSPEAFARAFKRDFKQTPSAFRKKPNWTLWHTKFQFPIPKREITMDVKIVDFPETKVAKIEHTGAAERVLETAAQFINWRKESKLSPITTSKTFGIPYSDPNTTEPDEFRFDICGTIEADVPGNTYGVKTGFIPGGRHAVVQHKGSHDSMDDSIYALYRDWLPNSGETPRGDFPCFFHYLNFIYDVEECDLLTDTYLPIE